MDFMNRKHALTYSVLDVVIFVLGVYAPKTEPISNQVGSTEISFVSLVINSKAADLTSGVLYRFSSVATADGNP
jgi:hypothetical protein